MDAPIGCSAYLWMASSTYRIYNAFLFTDSWFRKSGTRSVIALFHGRFLVSAVDYPLTIYAVVMYLWFMISQTIQRVSGGKYRIGLRWRSGYLWGALAILLAHFVLKNVIYIVTGLTPFLPG